MKYVNFSCQTPNLKVHNPTDIIRGHAEALIDETSRWRGAEARKNSVIVGAATQSSPRRTAAAPRAVVYHAARQATAPAARSSYVATLEQVHSFNIAA